MSSCLAFMCGCVVAGALAAAAIIIKFRMELAGDYFLIPRRKEILRL